MQKILNLGFIKVGVWKFKNDSFDHSITTHLVERNLLYSFVCNKDVLYIGKTSNTLKSRMNGYKNAGGSQRTNIRVKAEIVKLLEKREKVRVFILLDKASLKFKKYAVSLAAGLEDNLIKEIKPVWNYMGNSRIKEQEIPAEQENLIIENNQPTIADMKKITTAIIAIRDEYLKGKFNFPKKQIDYDLLAKRPSRVIVYIGVEGSYYFEANLIDTSGQARINNKALKNWFKSENLKIGDKFKVDIVEPTVFRIYK